MANTELRSLSPVFGGPDVVKRSAATALQKRTWFYRMRNTIRAVIGLAAALQLGCSVCGDEPSTTAVSPDGHWAATAYVRDCGATTSFVTHVVMRDANTPFRPWQSGGGPDQGLVFVMEQRPQIAFSWHDSTNLTIRVSGEGGRIVTKENRWQNVAIHYSD